MLCVSCLHADEKPTPIWEQEPAIVHKKALCISASLSHMEKQIELLNRYCALVYKYSEKQRNIIDHIMDDIHRDIDYVHNELGTF